MSPWLDVSMSDPLSEKLQSKDPLLTVEGFIMDMKLFTYANVSMYL